MPKVSRESATGGGDYGAVRHAEALGALHVQLFLAEVGGAAFLHLAQDEADVDELHIGAEGGLRGAQDGQQGEGQTPHIHRA